MPNMTPDEEWASVTSGNRDTGPVQKREMDALSEQVGQMLDGLAKANQGIEGAKKNLSGIWGLIVLAVIALWYVSGFVQQYQATLTNGSPALLKAMGEVKAEIATVKKIDDDRYDKLSEILRQQIASNGLVQQQINQMDRRVSRLEDK